VSEARIGPCIDTFHPSHMIRNWVGGPVMTNNAWNARRFGARDKLPCANCGNRTFLTRRSPAASYALQLERQTFTCLECDQAFERVVDADGNVMQSPAIELELARN
jgi:hypothetical protein